MEVKVTIPWGYLSVLLINFKVQYIIFNLFPYRVCPECIVVSLIEFICVGDVPRYLKAVLVVDILHLRLQTRDHFIFILQSEWGPPCEFRFVYQLIIFRVLLILDSV